MKYVLSAIVFLVPFVTFAQGNVEGDPSGPPWGNNALVVIIVTTALGVLSTLVHKIPGKAGAVLSWIIDLISANAKHKK